MMDATASAPAEAVGYILIARLHLTLTDPRRERSTLAERGRGAETVCRLFNFAQGRPMIKNW